MSNRITLEEAKGLKKYAEAHPDLEKTDPLQFFNIQMGILLGTFGYEEVQTALRHEINRPRAFIYINSETKEPVKTSFANDPTVSWMELQKFKNHIDSERPNFTGEYLFQYNNFEDTVTFKDNTTYTLESFDSLEDVCKKYNLRKIDARFA